MPAKRLPSIVPPLSLNEAPETTKIRSVTGKIGREASLMTTGHSDLLTIPSQMKL